MVRIGILIIIVFAQAAPAQAQAHRLLRAEDPAYVFIERLQRRGHLLDLHPTALPYTHGEIHQALDHLDPQSLSPLVQRWVAALKGALSPAPQQAPRVGFDLSAGVLSATQDRLDPVRLRNDEAHLYSDAAFMGYLGQGRVIAQVGLRHSTYYDQDPDGLDAVDRIMTRNEDSYVGFNHPYAALYLGRYSNHWGQTRQPAVLVSQNPRSYDHLSLRLGGPRLAIRSLLGELDSITADGRFTGTAGDDSIRVGSERRYLAAHRIDWRPSRHLAFTFMEALLYSGANAGPSLKFANPLQVFIITTDNLPKNDENNGLIAAALWMHVTPVTLQGQLMVDDFDFVNSTEPASVALTGSLHYAGMTPVADLGLALTLVTPRAYNTLQTEGRYVYLQRGLATQFSDYVHVSATLDLYLDAAIPGLTLTPQLHLLAQGEGDIRQPFPTDDQAALLIGTVERTLRGALALTYQPHPRWWLRADLGVNAIQNKGFQEGANLTRFVGQLSFGGRLSLNRAIRQPFSP